MHTAYSQALSSEIGQFAASLKGAVENFKAEWQWERYLVGDKMFLSLALMKDVDPIVTVKLPPEQGDFLRQQHPGVVIPGYYMNKEHWNSIHLTAPIDMAFLTPLILESYNLVLTSLTKKKQKEISDSENPC